MINALAFNGPASTASPFWNLFSLASSSPPPACQPRAIRDHSRRVRGPTTFRSGLRARVARLSLQASKTKLNQERGEVVGRGTNAAEAPALMRQLRLEERARDGTIQASLAKATYERWIWRGLLCKRLMKIIRRRILWSGEGERVLGILLLRWRPEKQSGVVLEAGEQGR